MINNKWNVITITMPDNITYIGINKEAKTNERNNTNVFNFIRLWFNRIYFINNLCLYNRKIKVKI